MMRARKGVVMPMKRSASLAALLLLALPCAANDWKSLRRDANAMLSVDTQSIKRKGDEATLKYLVDFRVPQGNPGNERPYRSIVVSAKVNCKKRTMGITHTDAYAQYGAQGIVVAKTKLNAAEAALKPLERDSSDEDVWRFVCEDKKEAAK